jgi:nicotinate-nucleotide adenylyltransferase
MTNIGLIGGTFDPVHLGHLAIAEEARHQLGLAEVIFIPAGQPYFKALADISPAQHRVDMLKLALAGKPYFKVSLMEVKRPGPSYTIDTVSLIKSRLKTGDEIFFILGWDSLVTLYRWQEPGRLISLCRIAAAPRPDYPNPDVRQLEKDLPGISQRTVVLHNPLTDISASEIRERVRQGLPVDDMVPAPVAVYIKKQGLYREISTS